MKLEESWPLRDVATFTTLEISAFVNRLTVLFYDKHAYAFRETRRKSGCELPKNWLVSAGV